MVGAFLLLKILHCKNHKKNQKRKQKTQRIIEEEELMHHNETESSSKEVCVKIEKQDDQICRICLKEGNIPILGSEASVDLLEPLNMFGSIQVDPEDPYPKYLCRPCHALLQGAILFRKTAQHSDNLLRTETLQYNYTSPQEDGPLSDHYNEDSDNIHTEEPTVTKSAKLSCKTCEIQFETLKEYTEHRFSSEHENKRITCNVCKKSYVPRYYKKHLLTHSPEASFICDICGKKFTMQGQFSRHRMIHFNELPYKCPQCPYKGRFSESLRMHMRSHTGERPYQCTACPSRFVSKSNLNKHMLTHKEGYDFRCEVCARGFYTKRDLEMHIKADHNGIKEHKCRICGKAFGYRKQMMKHEVRVHKREKMKSGRMPIYLKLQSMDQQNGANDTKT